MIFEQADYLKVGKPSPTCALCGKALDAEERRLTVLVDRETGPVPVNGNAPESAESPDPEDASPAPGEAAGPTVVGRIATPPEPPATGKAQAKAPKKTNADEAADDPTFDRRDFCPQCWQDMKENAYFSFWMGRQRVENLPPRKMNRAERNIALTALFESLQERNGQEQDFTPHLFFLAHLLMKYRIFKWQPAGPHPETQEVMLRFSRAGAEAGEDDIVYVPDVEMPDEMVLGIKRDVEIYLHESTGQEIRL